MKEKIDVPYHVAIIPDGNRRWAKKRGLDPREGHEKGAENFEEIIKRALEEGVKCLSIWGSSMDNLKKRPLGEKRALLSIYQKYFEKLLSGKEIHEHEARVNVIGRWEEQFPERLKKTIREAIEKTEHYKKRALNFLLAYNGTDDILEAVRKIKNNFPGKEITEVVFKKYLMTADLPPVDFMIRTGGEPHNSNGFLMWDTADSQLFFSPVLFPDFGAEEFSEALRDYAKRGRRFGK